MIVKELAPSRVDMKIEKMTGFSLYFWNLSTGRNLKDFMSIFVDLKGRLGIIQTLFEVL